MENLFKQKNTSINLEEIKKEVEAKTRNTQKNKTNKNKTNLEVLEEEMEAKKLERTH